MTLRTLDYGNYGLFLIMGNAGFISSAVVPVFSLLGCFRLTEPRVDNPFEATVDCTDT